jgi:outer membrane protein assembly factor BamB
MKGCTFHAKILMAAVLGAASSSIWAQPSHITFHGAGGTDNARNLLRTGWNSSEITLTHEAIDNREGPSRFGKLWERRFVHETIAEQVYAQPLYYQGIVYAATQRNFVYALNATDGAIIWERQVDPPLSQERWNAKIGGDCGDVNPWHGITSTPVLDPDTNTLYVVAVTFDEDEIQMYKMHALNIDTGEDRDGWPVVLGGSYRGLAYEAYRSTQRGALTLFDGWAYATFSSRCDTFPWNGWVIGVNAANPSLPMRVFSSAPDSPTTNAGMWGSAGSSVDENGFLYVATGNGTFNGSNPNPPNNSFAQSVLRLNPRDPSFFVRSTANYYTLPNFTPTNNRDEDLGGSSVLVIPDQSDTPTDTPRMLLVSGKDGVVYLLNRDNLGGLSQPNGAQIQRLKIYLGDGSGGAKNAAAYFDAGDKGRFIYLAAGRNAAFIGNYAHWGDANIAMGNTANPARAEIGTGPALAVFNGRIFGAWVASDGTGSLFIKSSPDGRDWTNVPAPLRANVGTRSSPALAAFNGSVALAWVDLDTRQVLVKFSSDGRTWQAGGVAVGAQAAPNTSPALAVFNGGLWVSWIADNREVMLAFSFNGSDWSKPISAGETSDHVGGAPAIAEFNSQLYLSWINRDGVTQRRIFFKSSPDGLDWSGARTATPETVNLESRMALVVFDDLLGRPRLHMLWVRNQPNDRQVRNRSLGADLVTGMFELEPVTTSCNETSFGSGGVGAVAFNGNLHIAWVGNNPSRDILGKIAQPAFPGRGLVALQLAVGNGKSKLAPAWASPTPYTYQPSSAYVTSNGQNDPIVWSSDPNAAANKPLLRGFHAVTGQELYNSERTPDDRPSWNGVKFATPAVVDGRLFLGTAEGLVAYGIRE